MKSRWSWICSPPLERRCLCGILWSTSNWRDKKGCTSPHTFLSHSSD
jgi:hypothetical protein